MAISVKRERVEDYIIEEFYDYNSPAKKFRVIDKEGFVSETLVHPMMNMGMMGSMYDYRNYLIDEHEKKKYCSDVYRFAGPTRGELRAHESLDNAWKEYLTVRALLGLVMPK